MLKMNQNNQFRNISALDIPIITNIYEECGGVRMI